jgi:hypothetical protein
MSLTVGQERALLPGRTRAVEQQEPVAGARLFQQFCIFTPVLWVFGVLTLSAVLLTLRLAWARWPRGWAINIIVGAWLSIAVVQVVASILYSLSIGEFVGELHNLSSFAIIGWVFGALIIAVGSAHRFATERTVRAVSCLGVYLLVLEILCVPLRLMGFTPAGFQATPLGLLLPTTEAAKAYTSFVLYMREDTFGEQLSRLVLFFPWYTALGLGALSILFIGALERDWRWRAPSMIGAMIAAVFCWSRLSIFCMLMVGGLMMFLRLPRLLQITAVCLTLAAGYGAMVNGYDPTIAYEHLQGDVNAARPGSNMARDLIYRKSWEGFVASPWFGNGLDFPRALKTEPIAIGSHSTTYGLLYTAGAPGLAAFILAMLVTFIAMIWRYSAAATGSPERRALLVGICLMLCLAVYAPFEALYSLTLPCIVLFSWIGACFPSPRDAAVGIRAPSPMEPVAPGPHKDSFQRTRASGLRRNLHPSALASVQRPRMMKAG